MKRKILSILLCACMMCTLLPQFAMAGGDDTPLTLDINNGSINITETGYTQGTGDETAYTGDYVITGTSYSTTDTITIESQAAGSDIIFDDLWMQCYSSTAPLVLGDGTAVNVKGTACFYGNGVDREAPIVSINGAAAINIAADAELRMYAGDNDIMDINGSLIVTGSGNFRVMMTAGNKSCVELAESSQLDMSAYAGNVSFRSPSYTSPVIHGGTVKLAGDSIDICGAYIYDAAPYSTTLSTSFFDGKNLSIDCNDTLKIGTQDSVLINATGTVSLTSDTSVILYSNYNDSFIKGSAVSLLAPEVIVADSAIDTNPMVSPSMTVSSNSKITFLGNGVNTEVNGSTDITTGAKYGGDITDTRLDYSNSQNIPAEAITYTAGDGTVEFTPASGEAAAVLTFNNATLNKTLNLPKGDSDTSVSFVIRLNGSNKIVNSDYRDEFPYAPISMGYTDLTITSTTSGSLELKLDGYDYLNDKFSDYVLGSGEKKRQSDYWW